MKDIAIADLRNFVLMGHTGSGKTAILDAILFKLGVNDRMGSSADGSSMADWTEEEKERKITIYTKPFNAEYKSAGKKFGLVMMDTPGYADFYGQVVAASSVADAALIVVDAAGGIQVGTNRAWRRCETLGLPRGIVITGLDREGADFDATVKNLQSVWGARCRPLVIPVKGNKSVVDVLSAANVPADYTRKQTMVNAERFITPELKEFENRITGAHERAVALESELLTAIRGKVLNEADCVLKTAGAVSALDALGALADRAMAMRYVRPVIKEGDSIRIRDGRHPVIEQIPGSDRFVPNDTSLDCSENRLIIITGPNMAGKSTYIRQVALIVIMAQVGSFVPAAGAEIGIVDRIFTRVGASDDLVRGRSTFMVEMQETANILNNATKNSLVILDEIGRGTSTFDGISIAWAVAEYLHDKVLAKALFATHYHELTDIAVTMKGVKNYNVLVREEKDQVVFLRKIVEGAADKSYGIQVARLAGLPREVVDRAKEILGNLEEGEFSGPGQPKIAAHRKRQAKTDSSQLMLFGAKDG